LTGLGFNLGIEAGIANRLILLGRHAEVSDRRILH
jgi:hypothetical protein